LRPAPLAAALVVALAPAGEAAAQAFDGTRGVDTYTGPVISPARILGLGGAYVAVAEGLAGAQANPAAIAQRDRHLARSWDWDWLLTWYLPNPRDVSRQDLGNDGRSDAGLSGLANAQLGLSFQSGPLGVGVFARGWTVAAPRTDAGSVQMEIKDVSLAAGWSAFSDVLVLGASWTAVSGAVQAFSAAATAGSTVAEKVEYSGNTLRFGALYRPRGQPWRLGVALYPAATARASGDRSAVPVATPAQFVFPATASVGVSAWIGPNARRYNEPPPFALENHPEWGPGPEWEESRRRPVLVSAQVDVVGTAPSSVTVESAVAPEGQGVPSGRSASLALRAGAEWEPFAESFRVRGGGYLEPSRTGASPRPHGTFGAEVRIPFWMRDLQLGLAGDVAERFQNVSLSLGFWSSLGPHRPTPFAPAP
jgi:hypothetical protein